mgnify:CR=1 FL=1
MPVGVGVGEPERLGRGEHAGVGVVAAATQLSAAERERALNELAAGLDGYTYLED